MKTVGNVLTLLFTIFIPVMAILFLVGVPPIVQIAVILVYAIVLYRMVKEYVLAKILVWNGYCYWYLKSLLSDKEFRAVIYCLDYRDHLRLQDMISRTEYLRIIELVPKGDREAVEWLYQYDFERRLSLDGEFNQGDGDSVGIGDGERA
jgi:hypothetical protein